MRSTPKPGISLKVPYDCQSLMIHGSIFSWRTMSRSSAISSRFAGGASAVDGGFVSYGRVCGDMNSAVMATNGIAIRIASMSTSPIARLHSTGRAHMSHSRITRE
jgi:Na+-driven multidrug efflux pump